MGRKVKPDDITDAQWVLAKDMRERALEESVRRSCADLDAIARGRGQRFLRYHTHRSQHSPAGFPDDVIVGPGGMLYRELKREGEEPSPEQQVWLDLLAARGNDVGVWKPRDLFSGRIARELQAVLDAT